MIKKIYLILIIFILLLSSFSIIKISKDPNPIKIIDTVKELKIASIPIKKLSIIPLPEKHIGYIKIDKINLNESLYPIDSSNNTVSRHVSIMKESTPPNNSNSLMILAAHSGEGRLAYFDNLDKLKENDIVVLEYENKNYSYIVKGIKEEKKNGFITFNRESNKQLILTTCSPNRDGYQLIVNCIEKESN